MLVFKLRKMPSTGVAVAPQAKNVVVFKNGDPFFTGRKLVVNQRQILTFETFLNEVTNNINAPVAVRNIYTPQGGHRVGELNDLQNGCHYVAAGFEKFKKIEWTYEIPRHYFEEKQGVIPGVLAKIYPSINITKTDYQQLIFDKDYRGMSELAMRYDMEYTGAESITCDGEVTIELGYLQKGNQKPNGNRRKNGITVRAVYSNRENVSARWRKYIQMPCVVNIFRNGDLLSPPFRLIIPKHVMSDWDKILSMVTEKANIRTGAVRRLCTMDGHLIGSGAQLESGQYYVAVGSEKFKHLPYLELQVSPQNTHRHQQMIRHKNHSKECIVSQDGVSDSALLSSPDKSGNRRVQSTGDAGAAGAILSPQTVRRNGQKSTSQEENSIFFAKPVKVKLNRNRTRNSQLEDANKEDRSVFKVKEKRAELQGAQEIPDDENTKVELPIDKRDAETVEDEVIAEEGTDRADESRTAKESSERHKIENNANAH